MKKLISLLLILVFSFCAYAQQNTESPPKRDISSSMNLLSEISGWKYATTQTVTVASANVNSFTYYFEWSDWDSTYHRTNVQLFCKFTGGAAANYQPLYFYYKLITYAGTALADSFYINDMVSEWWTNSVYYSISLPPLNFPAIGIEVYCINTGAASVVWISDVFTSQRPDFSGGFEQYSIADTLQGDTISGVFAIINLDGLHSIDVSVDSLGVTADDSFKFEIRPAWLYTGSSTNTAWIQLDSLNWRTGVGGIHRIESLTGYLPPCPFVEWRAFSGITDHADTLGVTTKFGGYRR